MADTPGGYLILSGAGQQRHVALRPGRLIVGSDPGCDLVLAGGVIAGRHAEITLAGGRATAKALDGPLCWRGEQVERCQLEPGDVLQLGEASLLYQADQEQTEVRLAKSPTSLEQYAIPDAGGERLVRFQQRFRLLLKLSSGSSSRLSYAELLDELMAIIFQALAPERAALVLAQPDGQLRVEAARHGRRREPWNDLQVSSTILGRVIESGEAFITADARQAEEVQQVHSVQSKGIRSALCVPYVQRGRIAGALYVDHRGAPDRFDEDDLDFLTMLGHLASATVQNVLEYQAVRSENARLRAGEAQSGELVGRSPALLRLREQIAKVARSDLPVLILGERGTGKELAARAIHQQSAQSQQGAFVAVNCAAVPENLVESMLFGHERGAFTGAERRHQGFFEQAHGGTLFLDEIGDLKLPAQAAILRALQEGEIRRVGSSHTLEVHPRVISATNYDLAARVAAGEFRGDLYDRLNVLPLLLPPLRERAEDIPLLAGHFARGRVKRISATAVQCLKQYSWPGNVRELRNMIERAIVMGDAETIWPEDLPPALRLQEPGRQLTPSLEVMERDHIIRVLRQTEGNISRAAEILGIGRITVYKKLKKYRLDPADFKAAG